MNSLIAVTLLCLVAMACAGYYDDGYYGGYDGHRDGYNRGYGYGFRRTGNGIEAVYNNAARQVAVNRRAEHVGASSGTAYRYGVPGTGNYFNNDREGEYHFGYGG